MRCKQNIRTGWFSILAPDTKHSAYFRHRKRPLEPSASAPREGGRASTLVQTTERVRPFSCWPELAVPLLLCGVVFARTGCPLSLQFLLTWIALFGMVSNP